MRFQWMFSLLDLMKAWTECINFCIWNSYVSNKTKPVASPDAFGASIPFLVSSGELHYKDLYFCFTLLKTSYHLLEVFYGHYHTENIKK